jgi:dTDP-glucose 4,6-dehydratase
MIPWVLPELEDDLRLLVTGGAGFIGSNFLRQIAEFTDSSISEVIVLDSLTYAGTLSNLESLISRKKIKFIKGDICDFNRVREIVDGIDAVVNFAAESHVDRSILGATEFVHSNIVGVQVLLDTIIKSRRKIRFLQVSTDEVYGSITLGSWNEDSPLLPNSPYSASKAAGELLVRAYFMTHGLDVLVTRSSNNYGPHHFPEKLIPLFITNLLEGKKLPVYGSGKNVRDWLHVDDHCRGIYQVLTQGRSGEIYNIGGGEELTNLEITRQILAAMNSSESSIEYVEDRKGHDLRYSVDWTKIKHELNYTPQVKFKDGLKNTIDWYVNNKEWWEPLKRRAEL